MLQSLRFICIAMLGTVFMITACSDDPLAVNDEPPELPPASSMQIDFSTLLGDSSSQQEQVTTQAIDYYVQAVYKAGSLENLIESNLSTPRALLAEAHDTVAVQNEEQQWEWRYLAALDSIQYQSRIRAERITSGTVDWSVYVTSEQADLNNRLFYSGTSTDNGAKGSWTVNSLESGNSSNEKTAAVSWQMPEQNTMEVTLEILTNANGHMGDSLAYVVAPSVREVTHYDAGTAETTTIRWDPDTRAGSIIAPDVNDGQKACWDAELQNVSCSGTETENS